MLGAMNELFEMAGWDCTIKHHNTHTTDDGVGFAVYLLGYIYFKATCMCRLLEKELCGTSARQTSDDHCGCQEFKEKYINDTVCRNFKEMNLVSSCDDISVKCESDGGNYIFCIEIKLHNGIVMYLKSGGYAHSSLNVKPFGANVVFDMLVDSYVDLLRLDKMTLSDIAIKAVSLQAIVGSKNSVIESVFRKLGVTEVKRIIGTEPQFECFDTFYDVYKRGGPDGFPYATETHLSRDIAVSVYEHCVNVVNNARHMLRQVYDGYLQYGDVLNSGLAAIIDRSNSHSLFNSVSEYLPADFPVNDISAMSKYFVHAFSNPTNIKLDGSLINSVLYSVTRFCLGEMFDGKRCVFEHVFNKGYVYRAEENDGSVEDCELEHNYVLFDIQKDVIEKQVVNLINLHAHVCGNVSNSTFLLTVVSIIKYCSTLKVLSIHRGKSLREVESVCKSEIEARTLAFLLNSSSVQFKLLSSEFNCTEVDKIKSLCNTFSSISKVYEFLCRCAFGTGEFMRFSTMCEDVLESSRCARKIFGKSNLKLYDIPDCLNLNLELPDVNIKSAVSEVSSVEVNFIRYNKSSECVVLNCTEKPVMLESTVCGVNAYVLNNSGNYSKYSVGFDDTKYGIVKTEEDFPYFEELVHGLFMATLITELSRNMVNLHASTELGCEVPGYIELKSVPVMANSLTRYLPRFKNIGVMNNFTDCILDKNIIIQCNSSALAEERYSGVVPDEIRDKFNKWRGCFYNNWDPIFKVSLAFRVSHNHGSSCTLLSADEFHMYGTDRGGNFIHAVFSVDADYEVKSRLDHRHAVMFVDIGGGVIVKTYWHDLDKEISIFRRLNEVPDLYSVKNFVLGLL